MKRQVKIFSAYHDIAAIEQDINRWLSQHPEVRIITVTQSQTNVAPQGWNLIISVFFEAVD
jgi:hypothetical protein